MRLPWVCSWVKPGARTPQVFWHSGRTKLQDSLPPVLSPKKILLAGSACSQTGCLSPACLMGFSQPKPQSSLLVLPPGTFLWSIEPAVRLDVNNRAYCWAAVELVCIVIFPSPWVKSHFGVVLVIAGGCLQNEVSQLPLWKDSCQVGRVG